MLGWLVVFIKSTLVEILCLFGHFSLRKCMDHMHDMNCDLIPVSLLFKCYIHCL